MTTKPQSTTEQRPVGCAACGEQMYYAGNVRHEPELVITVQFSNADYSHRNDGGGVFYVHERCFEGFQLRFSGSSVSPASAAPVVDNDAVRRARDWLKSYEAEKYYEGIEGMFRYTAQLIDHLLAVIYATPRPISSAGVENCIRAALENIASQRLRSEIEPIDGEVTGDFEGAYDIMINVARDALAAATAAPVGQSDDE